MRRSVSRIRPCSSRSAISRSCALAFELLDVLERLLVLLLGERVDRAELLAPPLQALDARRAAPRAPGRGAARPPPRARARASAPAGGARVSASCAWSRACCARTSPRVTSSPRCLRRAWTRDSSPAHSRSSAASFSPAARSAASSASSASTRVRMAAPAALQRGREALGDRPQPLVALEPAALVPEPPLALGALALGALGQPLLGPDRRLELRAALRARPLVGRRAPLRDHPARMALGLRGLVARPRGGPRLAVGRVARGIGLGDRGAARSRPRPARPARPGRRARPARSALRAGCARLSTRSSPPAETCRSSRVAGDQTRPSASDGDAAEAGIEPLDGLDDPHVGEQRGGEPPRRRVARRADVRREPRRAGGGSSGRRRRAGGGDRRERRGPGERGDARERRGLRGEPAAAPGDGALRDDQRGAAVLAGRGPAGPRPP